MALDSYTDIKAWILKRAEEPTDGTSDFDGNADTSLIEAWRDLMITEPWMCIRQFPPYAFTTPLPVTTLTLTAAAGLAVAGTLSAVYAASLAGWVFIQDGSSLLLRVTAHAAGTNAVTLDAVPSALVAATGKFAQIDYALPAGFGLFVDGGLWGSDKSFVPVRREEELRRMYPLPAYGTPDMAARTTKGYRRLSHYADVVRRFEVTWTKELDVPSGAGLLTIDPHLRPIFADLGLYYLLIDKSDMKRAKEALSMASAKLDKAITYEERLRAGLGQAARRTINGPYNEGSTFASQRSTRPYG